MTEDETKEVATMVGIASGVAMYQTLAVIGALAERRLIDPLKVADWAKVFANGLGPDLAPDVHDSIRQQLEGFAEVIRSLNEMPRNAGRG